MKKTKLIKFKSLEQAKLSKKRLLENGYKRIAIYTNYEVYHNVFCGNIEITKILETRRQ